MEPLMQEAIDRGGDALLIPQFFTRAACLDLRAMILVGYRPAFQT